MKQALDSEEEKIQYIINKMMELYKEIFNEKQYAHEVEETPEIKELTDKELETAVNKTLQLNAKLSSTTRFDQKEQIEKLISSYKKLINATIKQKIDRANTEEELREIARKLPKDIFKVSESFSDIHKKIIKIQQARFQKERENIPKEIKEVINTILNGTLDPEMAKKAIAEEAATRFEKAPKNKFALTEEKHKRQIVMQIHMELRENTEQYKISNPIGAIESLVQLGGDGTVQAVNTVIQNLIGQKEYNKALFICGRKYEGLSKAENEQIYSLRRKVKAAKLGDAAKEMLTGDKDMKTRIEEYNNLKIAMRVDAIKAKQILIGTINNGTVPVYLDKIWDIDIQR